MNKTSLPIGVLTSCFIAGALEMYDFLIFGFLSSVIHKNYLSFMDAGNALIVTYALFAVGFIFRPLGSIIFGHIGDKKGRKAALITSVSFMGAASISMALLPSYHTIGILSCYIIVMIRIIQGISVGGEYSGAIIYAIENVNKKNIGLVGSIALSGCVLGLVIAVLVSRFLQSEWLPEYSWRFAFLIGGGLSGLGYFIRKNLKESLIFQSTQNKRVKIPLLEGFNFYKLKMLAVLLLAGASNANFYYAVVFMPNYIKNIAEVNNFNGLYFVIILFIFVPFAGWCTDKIGRIKVALISCTLISAYNLVFLFFLTTYSNYLTLNIIIISYALLLSLVFVSVNILVLEIFPIICRFSCGATSYSIGNAIFGGTAPMVCSLIIQTYESNTVYLGGYIALISILGAIGCLIIIFEKRTSAILKRSA